MKERYLKEIETYLKKQSRQKIWYKIVTCLAAVVVFITTYALILPAITLEKTCEIPVHTHSNACYTQVTSVKKKIPVCVTEGKVAHHHDSFCYDEEGQLWCTLEEVKEHTHTESCYAGETPETEISTSEGEPAGTDVDAGEGEPAGTDVDTGEGEPAGTDADTGEGEPAGTDVDADDNINVSTDVKNQTPHTHTDTCWAEREDLICGFQILQTETGSATESDAEKVHEHTEACYETVRECICGYDEKNTVEEEKEEISEEEHTSATEGTSESEAASETDRELICGQEELPVHQHTDACFEMIEVPVDTTILSCDNISPEHEHTERCYGTWELTCGMEEHVHTSVCTPDLLSEQEQARVDAVIEWIDGLPTVEEIEKEMNAFDEDSDMERYEEYTQKLLLEVRTVYAYYEDLGSKLQKYVTNREKMMELEWIWSAETMEITDTVTVYQVNQYEKTLASMVCGGTVGEKLDNGMRFYYWNAVIVEKRENGKLYVEKVIGEENDKRNLCASTEDGFVLLWYQKSVDVKEGDEVRINFAYQSVSGYQKSGYGRILFGTEEGLTVITGADTRDLIEVNLYDYGSTINEMYEKDSGYPGFQQDSGTIEIPGALASNSFNFGNNITSDLKAGKTGVTNGNGINSINSADRANRPVSGAMLPTLKDGYPALADGTSLRYLFSSNSNAEKKNTKSVSGLFQYDEESGAYTFNSRENHAQFNSEDDTFTLYRQIITSNFMMYPFGNFLPFNDIENECTPVDVIDRAYFQTIQERAAKKADNGAGSEYRTLASNLGTFISKMDAKYSEGWTSADCMREYFQTVGISDQNGNGPEFSEKDSLLEQLYSIDYDEPTDFYFGMEMKMNFMQPKDGLTGKDGKQPMKFYFTGDDDVWVYIDGVLFLDLSGIHRHVGGEIDFVDGVVKYYALDTETGDVSAEPYRTKTFAEIFSDAGVSTPLNQNGTLKDYSNHTFNFYYMERGAGSGVCRMNFNFPLLRTISVKKSLRVDDSSVSNLLGNPDFHFQILKEDGTELFFGEGVKYEILEQDGTGREVKYTGKQGIFTLKAGQTAIFSEIEKSAGNYFVRELLDEAVFEQYENVMVDGTAAVLDVYSNVTIGSETFKGADSPCKDAADGSTIFEFCNQADEDKLGSLSIKKTLVSVSGTDAAISGEEPEKKSTQEFCFTIALDEKLLPKGTRYRVLNDTGESRTMNVSQEGMISLAAGETAVIEHILAGTRFTVEETTESSSGYAVTYKLDGKAVNSDHVESRIEMTDVTEDGTGRVTGTQAKIEVVNTEAGASVLIPIHKTLEMPDGKTHSYQFMLTQVTDQSGITSAESGFKKEMTVDIQDKPQKDAFLIAYPKSFLETADASSTFYYKITETDQTEVNTQYDQSYYVVAVKVTNKENGSKYSAEVTNLWKYDKNGVLLEKKDASGTDASKADGSLWTASFTNAIRFYELPETGGTGTTMFYVIGTILAAAAVVLLVVKKRMDDK